MGLSAPWTDANLEPTQTEQFSVMFKRNRQQPQKIFPGIKPTDLGAPWANAYL